MPKKTILSYVSANDIAAQLGYNMQNGWGEAEQSVISWYGPEEHFESRFEALLIRIKSIGFNAVDLYVAHLGGIWAEHKKVQMAVSLLKRYGLKVTSLVGYFGDRPIDFEATCHLAQILDTKLLSGSTKVSSTNPKFLIEALDKYDLHLAIENHFEVTAEEHLDKIESLHSHRVGLAVDTGWYGTQGVDPVEAIHLLGDRVMHIHLKDIHEPNIKKPGITLVDMGHESCKLGDGIIDIKSCLEALDEINYTGPVAIEHEPEDRDPALDCKLSLEYVNVIIKKLN